jgi:hypothetical protein
VRGAAMSDKLIPLTDFGQLKQENTLLIEGSKGEIFIAEVRQIINPGKSSEEIILAKGRNVYFVVSNYLQGKSWVKSVDVINNAKITNICNTKRKFEIY